jgi:hypothetical protein
MAERIKESVDELADKMSKYETAITQAKQEAAHTALDAQG